MFHRIVPVMLTLAAGLILIPYLSLTGADVKWQVVTGAYVPDEDSDGVPDAVEAAGPNGGDANDDGLQDSEQDDVATLPNAETGDFITLAVPGLNGISLENVSSTSASEIGEALPGGGLLPAGLLQFELHGVTPGDTVSMEVIFEEAVDLDGWWKYGPASPGAADSYFSFRQGDAGVPEGLGADFADGLITALEITLRDGAKGDADFEANGVIVDPTGGGNSGMAVELQGAQIFRVGRNVHLKWRTASEIKHAGFHVYRVDAEGNEQRVNRRLIAPKGGELSGGDYHQIDWLAPTVPLEYWIEDLDTLGNAKRHGPFKVGSPAPQQPVEPDSAP